MATQFSETDLTNAGFVPDGKGGWRPGKRNTVTPAAPTTAPAANCIFIPGDVPSSKNSKQIFRNKKTDKPFITDSAVAKRYRKEVSAFYKQHTTDWNKLISGKPLPLRVQFYFIRKTKQRFDYSNIVQLVQDLMVEYGWISDDNSDVLIPDFSAGYECDKNRPGVIIKPL